MKIKQNVFDSVMIDLFKNYDFSHDKNLYFTHFDCKKRSPLLFVLSYKAFRNIQRKNYYELKSFKLEKFNEFFSQYKNKLQYKNISLKFKNEEMKTDFSEEERLYLELIDSLHQEDIDNQLIEFLIDMTHKYKISCQEFYLVMQTHEKNGENITQSQRKTLFQSVIYSNFFSVCQKNHLNTLVMTLVP